MELSTFSSSSDEPGQLQGLKMCGYGFNPSPAALASASTFRSPCASRSSSSKRLALDRALPVMAIASNSASFIASSSSTFSIILWNTIIMIQLLLIITSPGSLHRHVEGGYRGLF